MEYANGGNLVDFINHKKGLNEAEALFYFGQIIDAFRYLRLEKNRIMHRDIKPENILI
jgi:serine/threonine protein kinase